MSVHRTAALLAATSLSLLTAVRSTAELELPGFYRKGTFHIDRWHQRRFAGLYVSAELDKTLTPFLLTVRKPKS